MQLSHSCDIVIPYKFATIGALRMSTIMRYFMNMLPNICVVLPIYLFARVIFIICKELNANMLRERILLPFVLAFAMGTK